jgi:hypothetical protein
MVIQNKYFDLVQRIRGVNGLIRDFFDGSVLLIKDIGLLYLMA